MNKEDFGKKLANIQVAPPDEDDKQLLGIASKQKKQAVVSHEQLFKELNYSGKISLRVPKSLHRDLVSRAKEEGISLNQFILYKLAK